MIVILILITLSLLLATGFLGAFLWAVKTDQYEDVYTPSLRILSDSYDIKPGKQISNNTGDINGG